ncbi:MAG: septal ring lytic transglycosylase RlpA family protein, partial [Dehalococcoidia bacterium]
MALTTLGLLAFASVIVGRNAGHGARFQPQHAVAAAAAAPAAAVSIGLATFYADDFNGGTMANGATFNMNDPTIAAANRWPLGTRLRLHRVPGSPWDSQLTASERKLYFGRSVVVTVSDRGAFTHALDLSRGAFALLGRPEEGVIRVAIEP